MDYTDIKKRLREMLNDERYSHTLGTADCARELAKKFALDEEKCYLAGLLHDSAKCMGKETLRRIIKENGLDVGEAEFNNPKTLHASVSAFIAETEFGITDDEILSAIRWHTLGKLDMTDFEKVIFIADKIEPNTRDKDYSQKIRKYLDEENGLNKAMLICYKETIKSLVERDLKICLETVEIYNKLQDLM